MHEREEPERQGSGSIEPQQQQQQQNDEGRKSHSQDGEDDEQPPKPVGFWDASLSKVRKEVVLGWLRTTLILCTFILTVLSMYWAVLFPVEQNLEALTVAIVSFDAQFPPYVGTRPIVGQAVEQAAVEEAQKANGVLGYTVRQPSDYDQDPIAVRQAVYEEQLWAAIIVNNNATALLEQAVATGNQSYDPLGAIQIIYNEARDQTTYDSYILPQLSQLQTNIQAQFGKQWIQQVLSNTSLDAQTYRRAPQALNPAIGASMFNLRPFTPPTATPAVTIGLIYLIIIAFFSFSFYLPIHTKYLVPKGHPPMHFYQVVIWRYFATLTAYMFLSLAYSLVSLAFQIPFSNKFPHSDTNVANNPDAFGKGTFVVYWMLNWVGMAALGLASENVTMVVGQPWTGLWLIFWVISNVSTAFYALELAPGFFRWGYAWPLHQVVNASRTLLFDTHSKLGLNFGILFAWCAVNTALFPFCCLFMRWKTNKEEVERRQGLRQEIRYLVDG